MGYNHRSARKQFEDNWIKEVRMFRDAGMTCEKIAAMYDFELEQFRKDRSYQEKTVLGISEEMWEHILGIGTSDTYFQNEQSDVEIIVHDVMEKPGAVLTEQDKKIICLLLKGYNQPQAAKLLGISQQAISKHLIRIKKFLS